MDYEAKYYELLENKDRACDIYFAHQTSAHRYNMDIAVNEYYEFCIEVLDKLLAENVDILKRLKDS